MRTENTFEEAARFFERIQRIERERDHYQAALIRIATEDYRGPKPATTVAAQVALDQVEAWDD